MAAGTSSPWRMAAIGVNALSATSHSDYIRLYEPIAASLLCDRMEEIIAANRTEWFSLCG